MIKIKINNLVFIALIMIISNFKSINCMQFLFDLFSSYKEDIKQFYKEELEYEKERRARVRDISHKNVNRLHKVLGFEPMYPEDEESQSSSKENIINTSQDEAKPENQK